MPEDRRRAWRPLEGNQGAASEPFRGSGGPSRCGAPTHFLDRHEIAELHELSSHLLDRLLVGGGGEAEEEADPREAEWVRMMTEMREVGTALAEALEELAAK